MDNFDDEIAAGFLIEAKDLLLGAEQCFLTLEKNPSNLENLNQLLRLAHNLKGSSGAVGFTDLAEITHKLETLLIAIKESKVTVTKYIFDLLLRTNDYLIKAINTLQINQQSSCANPTLVEELVQALVRTECPENASSFQAPEICVTAKEFELKINKKSSIPPIENRNFDENIRVSLFRIEQLLNNVGELSILQAVMTQQSFDRSNVISPLMRETLSAMTKIVKETQSISMGLRMLPVKQMFQKMQRLARDTASSLEKEVELHLSGEETEIDKTILEQLGDPLVHIIRNAVDHGLEDKIDRAASGKSQIGNIYLSAFHQAGQVVINIKDDGKGLDPEKLVSKAKAKGIISQGASLSIEQAYQLIFAPGFSTKEAVTNVSGRGVGMDVVKTNVTALQGQIEIETELGKGTCFRILLPLTLAIVDSVIVRVGEERFVIPLVQISEFFRPQQSEINFVYGRSELLTLREETISTLRLSSLIGRDQGPKKEAWMQTALVISDGRSAKIAVMVDQVISQQQVVVKPLGNEVGGLGGLMGSAILGDGRPALILDLFEITKSIRTAKSQHVIFENKKLETA